MPGMPDRRKVECRIRRAVTADEAEILDCLDSAFGAYKAFYSEAGYQDTVLTPETFRDRFASMTVLAATISSGELVGTIGFGLASPGEGHVRGMAVRPEWQGRGIARRLLEAAEGELRGLGCVRVTLDTTEPLARAISFYQKCGYRPSGKVGDYFGMPLFEYVKAL